METPAWIEFRAYGDPVPKGSTHAFKHKFTGKIITKQNGGDRLYDYQNKIGLAAARALVRMSSGRIRLKITFGIKRPKGHFGTGKNTTLLKPGAPKSHIQVPDLDKLVRSVLDALTGIAYEDDSQVTGIAASKIWSTSSATEITVFYE